MFNITVGSKVISKAGETGTIVSVGDYIVVDFGTRTAKWGVEAFVNGSLKFIDEDAQREVDAEIARLDEEKKKRERRRIAAEEARERTAELALAAQRTAEEAAKKTPADERAKNKNKSKKSEPHPYIAERRNAHKPVIFMVCQNDNYAVESHDGYIWAPDHKTKGETDFASHAEMDQVKAGDIIIHHFGNRIYAISVAKKDCERKAATLGHPNCGIIGRYVELSYHFLDNKADTSGLKTEKVKYGSMKYGPFEKTGKNKEGFYLSELADELASAFVEAAIAANPTDAKLRDFRNKI